MGRLPREGAYIRWGMGIFQFRGCDSASQICAPVGDHQPSQRLSGLGLCWPSVRYSNCPREGTLGKAMSIPRQKLARRACDPCRIRHVKCSEASPCTGCIAAGLECTSRRVQSARGPRSLRPKTIQRLSQSQGERCSEPQFATGAIGNDTTKLIRTLGIYAARLFPLWPIVDVPYLIHALSSEPLESGARCLANAVTLATIAQLKLVNTSFDVDALRRDVETAAEGDEVVDALDGIRVSFFLHIYHENQTAGGTKSLVHLREAITRAQLLRIDREATYVSLPESTREISRRVLWLLFVTER